MSQAWLELKAVARKAEAACGCALRRSGVCEEEPDHPNIALDLCPVHERAPALLAACEIALADLDVGGEQSRAFAPVITVLKRAIHGPIG